MANANEPNTEAILFDGFDFSGVDFGSVLGKELGDIPSHVTQEDLEAAVAAQGEEEEPEVIVIDEQAIQAEPEKKAKKAPGRPKKAAVSVKAEMSVPDVEQSKRDSSLDELVDTVDRLALEMTQLRRGLETLGEAHNEAFQWLREKVTTLTNTVLARVDSQETYNEDLLTRVSAQAGNLEKIHSVLENVNGTLSVLGTSITKLSDQRTLVANGGNENAPTSRSVQVNPTPAQVGPEAPQVVVAGLARNDVEAIGNLVRRQTKRAPVTVFSKACSQHVKKQGHNWSAEQIEEVARHLGLVDDNDYITPGVR